VNVHCIIFYLPISKYQVVNIIIIILIIIIIIIIIIILPILLQDLVKRKGT